MLFQYGVSAVLGNQGYRVVCEYVCVSLHPPQETRDLLLPGILPPAF